MRNPIRSQLLIPLLAAMVIAVLSTASLSAWLSMARSLAELKRRQDEVVAVLQEARFPLTSPILEQMSRLSRHQFILWDNSRQRFTESSILLPAEELNVIVEKPRAGRSEERHAETIRIGAVDYSVKVAHLSWQPESYLLVLTSHDALSQVRWTAIWPPLAVWGGTLLWLVPWLLTLTRGWSRRIETIQQQVAAVAQGGHLGRTEAPPPDDELAALMSDIVTMDRRLKELQRENLQLERERLMAQLAAGFAHQFRNGVAGVSLALQLHSNRCGSPSDGSLSVALKQLSLLEAEIRGILALGRHAGTVKERLSIIAVVDDAVELVTPSMEHQRIQIEWTPPDRAMSVVAARDGLLSALLNLLLNAIDAAGPRGKIRIGLTDTDEEIVIQVQDNGAGPQAEISQTMTEPFVTSKPDGVGLGLAIVSEVARDHGGSLRWRRDEGWTTMELRVSRGAPGALREFESEPGIR